MRTSSGWAVTLRVGHGSQVRMVTNPLWVTFDLAEPSCAAAASERNDGSEGPRVGIRITVVCCAGLVAVCVFCRLERLVAPRVGGLVGLIGTPRLHLAGVGFGGLDEDAVTELESHQASTG
jgi:hypothetical protein